MVNHYQRFSHHSRALRGLLIILTAGLLPAPITCQAAVAEGASLAVESPNGRVKVAFSVEQGKAYYAIGLDEKRLIENSRLGAVLDDKGSLDAGLKLESHTERLVDETWQQPWGEKRTIRNHYREMRAVLRRTTEPQRTMAVVFRVFDDGVGFRYEWPEQSNLGKFQILDELTEFHLVGDYTAWWIPAFQPNRYEYLYQRTPLEEIPTVHTPLTLERSDGIFLSFHEASLVDYASMTLANGGEQCLTADLVPWSDGVKVKASAPFRSPWRTIQIAESAGELITSYLILNLNEPNKLADVPWIKPGKYAGVWWEMHLGTKTWGSGPKHGATTENVKKHIDFAAENGMVGVLVEGWNQGWDGDWVQNGDRFQFTVPYPDFDIREITRYAAEKGVRLIGHHETGGSVINYEGQLEDAYAYCEAFGINAVKSGYVAHGTGIKRLDENHHFQNEWHHGQFMVRHYRKVIEEAARHHVMLDVHEPIKPTGERRTYPNMMTREGARGQEYEAWSGDGGNPPDHTTILPFTRMLAGPMDYCPGVFDLLFEEERPDNRVNSTLAKQLALYVVLYSPLQMVPDLPENYMERPGAFQFIKDVPTDWEDTRVLHAKIGDYVTIARQKRGSDEWFLGSITDETARELEAPLEFLEPGREYVAEIYADGEKADWQTNPYAVDIRRQHVTHDDILPIHLAAGGGTAIRFVPKDTVPSESKDAVAARNND